MAPESEGSPPAPYRFVHDFSGRGGIHRDEARHNVIRRANRFDSAAYLDLGAKQSWHEFRNKSATKPKVGMLRNSD